MRKTFYIPKENKSTHKFSIESIDLDTETEYFKDYGSSYSDNINDAKNRCYEMINSRIAQLRNKIWELQKQEKELFDELDKIKKFDK